MMGGLFQTCAQKRQIERERANFEREMKRIAAAGGKVFRETLEAGLNDLDTLARKAVEGAE